MMPYVSGDIIAAGFNAYEKEKVDICVSMMYYNTSYFMVMYIPSPAINK